MEEKGTINVLKFGIVFFILLNILVLSFGYYVIDSKIIDGNDKLNSDLMYLSRKKELLIEDLNVINKSKKDNYANLFELKNNLELLKKNINESTSQFTSTQAQSDYYLNKYDVLKVQNQELVSQKDSLQNKLDVKQQIIKQEQAAAQQAARKRVRRTRSS